LHLLDTHSCEHPVRITKHTNWIPHNPTSAEYMTKYLSVQD